MVSGVTQIQLTLEQHALELHGSTSAWVFGFFFSINTVNVFPLPYDFNIFFSLVL